MFRSYFVVSKYSTCSNRVRMVLAIKEGLAKGKTILHLPLRPQVYTLHWFLVILVCSKSFPKKGKKERRRNMSYLVCCVTNQNLHEFGCVSILENWSNIFLESSCSLVLSYKGTKIATEFSRVTPRPLGKPCQLICRERHRWKHRQQRPRLIRKKGSISVGQQGLLALRETNITLETHVFWIGNTSTNADC